MRTITNTENLGKYRSRCFLILEQILAFASSTYFVREVKDVSLNFKSIALQGFMLQKIFIQIGRSYFL